MNQNYVGLVISIAFVAIFAGLWLRKRAKLRRARAWPKETGIVDSTTLNMESTGNNQHAWVGLVKYSYKVQGAAFTGSLRRQFVLKKSADKWIGGFTTGTTLSVRYDPANAKDSVVFEEEQSGINPA